MREANNIQESRKSMQRHTKKTISTAILCVAQVLFSFSFTAPPWSRATLQQMSLREKIGQLFALTIGQEETLAQNMRSELSLSSEKVKNLIQNYHVGALLFLGNKKLTEQIALTNYYQHVSKVPLLVMQDLEWGLEMRIPDTINFPRNITLGAIQNQQLLYELGKEIGRQCKAIGVHVNLAPVVDINSNSKNPIIGRRSFGEEAVQVATRSCLLMKGLQQAGVMACAKHFPGHGDSSKDSHLELPVISHSKEQLYNRELIPFKFLIESGVGSIMNAHLKIPSLDPHTISTLSYSITTKLLQEELGFRGIIMTDGLWMGALKDYAPGDIEAQAFIAGCDMFLCSRDIPKAIDHIAAVIQSGKISEQELDRRVLKILEAKEKAGLPIRKFINVSNPHEIVNSAEAYALKKKLYQDAITTVKNCNNTLPLSQACSSASVVQIGGEHQSNFVNTLSAVCSYPILHVSTELSDVNIEKIVQTVAPCETIIIGLFDIQASARHKNFGIPQTVTRLLTDLKKAGKKIVLALFGNPYSLNMFGNEDAILMAYEDDPEAQEATANIIMGKLKAKGKLPITASDQFPSGLGIML
jgi:beta-N-acetylhexosaminidase